MIALTVPGDMVEFNIVENSVKALPKTFKNVTLIEKGFVLSDIK